MQVVVSPSPKTQLYSHLDAIRAKTSTRENSRDATCLTGAVLKLRKLHCLNFASAAFSMIHAPHACAMTFTTRAITGVMYQTVRFPPTLTMQLFFRLSVTGKSRGPDVPARGWFPSHDRNFSSTKGSIMSALLGKLWRDEEGQDIAEYAVMLAVILVIVVGTVRLVGSNANNVFSNVASSIQ